MDEGQTVGADGAAEEGIREPKWDSIAAQRDTCPTCPTGCTVFWGNLLSLPVL